MSAVFGEERNVAEDLSARVVEVLRRHWQFISLPSCYCGHEWEPALDENVREGHHRHLAEVLRGMGWGSATQGTLSVQTEDVKSFYEWLLRRVSDVAREAEVDAAAQRESRIAWAEEAAELEARWLNAQTELDEARQRVAALGSSFSGGSPVWMPIPKHLCLTDLIERLGREPLDKRVRFGFSEPHSYRGEHEEVAFELRCHVTVRAMLAAAYSAMGQTFEGWKGGEYTMEDSTPVWLVRGRGECGESVGAMLLEHLLADVVSEEEK